MRLKPNLAARTATFDRLGGTRCHPGEDNGATIWVSQDNEAAPTRLLRRPHDRQPSTAGVLLAGIRILDRKPNGCPANARAGWEDPSLVVASVIAVKDHPPRQATDDHDDVVLEEDPEAELLDVERSCLRQVRDEEDEALEVGNLHRATLPRQVDGD